MLIACFIDTKLLDETETFMETVYLLKRIFLKKRKNYWMEQTLCHHRLECSLYLLVLY